MATVWVGFDDRLGRSVAVKILRPHLSADAGFAARFRREARAAAALNHPGVVAVHDTGADQGDLYLVMELVDGETLREIIDGQAPLTPRAALDILTGILEALGEAHGKGLVHRDVKPENVLLRTDGVVKVADFGLARAVTSQTATAAAGTLLGTVAYLSPEQVEYGTADERSDVYASGLLLFEMLTGRKAFDGDVPINVAYQHVHGSVPAPSTLVPALAQELDDLVALATAKDPDDRPADAGEYLHEVARVRRLLSSGDLDLRPGSAATTESTTELALSRTTALPLVPRPETMDRTDYIAAISAASAGQPSPTPPATGAPTTGIPAGAGIPAGSRTPATTGIPAGTAPPDATPRPRSRGPRIVLWLVVLALLAAGAGFGGTWWNREHGPASMRTVPVVAGLPLAQAQAALAGVDLLTDPHDAFSETIGKGSVIEADPPAGDQLRKGSTVTLTVSKGQERYAVPKLAGLPQDQAQAALTKLNLALGKVTPAYDDQIPEGKVVSQSVPAGTSVKRGTAVAVVVSKGREPITISDYTNTDAGPAQAALTKLGFAVTTTSDFSDTVAKGKVISQNPSSGTGYKNDKISLLVSKGPDVVTVPNVVGRSASRAEAMLIAAGLTPERRAPLGTFLGLVQTQSKSPGAVVRRGTTVVIIVV